MNLMQLRNNMQLLVVGLIVLVTPSYQSDETELLTHLLKSYQKDARPVTNHSAPVHLKFGFELIQILSINEGEQTVQMKVWMRMSWINELLRWDQRKYGNVKKTKLTRNKIWTPDIFLEEDNRDDMSSGTSRYHTPITLEHNGLNTWLVPALLTTSCLLDVTYFPFDEQECQLMFLSWTHDKTEIDIDLDPRPVVTSNYLNSSSWDLIGIDRELVKLKYNCCPNPFVHVRYTLRLHRKPQYYVFNVVVPCIIQMTIVLFTFFLPPDSGERIGVNITVILVFAVYLEVVRHSLPKTSISEPTLASFYITAMAESAISLVATCFVLVIHFKGCEKGVPSMPDWIRYFFIDTMAKFLWVRVNLREYSNKGLLALKGGNETDGKADNPLLTSSSLSAVQNKGSIFDRNDIFDSSFQQKAATMDMLVSEVQIITKLIQDQNRQDEIEEEWQVLAKVFDRIFFVVFLFVFVISSLVILLPVHMKQVANANSG